MGTKKWIEVNAFVPIAIGMSNHIHLIWQIQEGHERDAVQRNFLKFVSQTIKRDLGKNHPKVFERFLVATFIKHVSYFEYYVMAKKVNTDTGFSFKSGKDFEKWLSKNHAASGGIWVRFYKKNSGIKAINQSELIDLLLCYGWITGPAKKGNESYVLWWVCPRKENSMWSKVNREHVERLISDKRMKPSGMAVIEKAKEQGKWHY